MKAEPRASLSNGFGESIVFDLVQNLRFHFPRFRRSSIGRCELRYNITLIGRYLASFNRLGQWLEHVRLRG